MGNLMNLVILVMAIGIVGTSMWYQLGKRRTMSQRLIGGFFAIACLYLVSMV